MADVCPFWATVECWRESSFATQVNVGNEMNAFKMEM